jgi:hypothetical protein
MSQKKYNDSYRIRLEKLKAVTWFLVVVARLLPILAALESDYLRRK